MEDELIVVEFICPKCGKVHHLYNILEESFDRFIHRRETGEHIQDIFPNMSRNDREKFLTGYCDKCQKEIFGELL